MVPAVLQRGGRAVPPRKRQSDGGAEAALRVEGFFGCDQRGEVRGEECPRWGRRDEVGVAAGAYVLGVVRCLMELARVSGGGSGKRGWYDGVIGLGGDVRDVCAWSVAEPAFPVVCGDGASFE